MASAYNNRGASAYNNREMPEEQTKPHFQPVLQLHYNFQKGNQLCGDFANPAVVHRFQSCSC